MICGKKLLLKMAHSSTVDSWECSPLRRSTSQFGTRSQDFIDNSRGDDSRERGHLGMQEKSGDGQGCPTGVCHLKISTRHTGVLYRVMKRK